MVNSDLEDDAEAIDDLEFDTQTFSADADVDADGEDDIDDDLLDAVEGGAGADDGTEGDDEAYYDESDEGEDEDEEDEAAENGQFPDLGIKTPTLVAQKHPPRTQAVHSIEFPGPRPRSPTRSLSPAHERRAKILASFNPSSPRSYTVEAICAIPHPTPTHSLASSLCISHLLTGSDDGYIRDYDIFAAVNGKNFLTAPQRHHCGVIEGTMKAGQVRFWWENPSQPDKAGISPTEELPLSPVYSLAMHSDALWALAGTDQGHINLFTVRHDPGRLCHVMRAHRGHVSALSIQHDEKGFLSAGWDGEAMHWDLNTGHITRKFTSHGAQLAAIAFRPLNTTFHGSHRMNGDYQEPSDIEGSQSYDHSTTVPEASEPPSRRNTLGDSVTTQYSHIEPTSGQLFKTEGDIAAPDLLYTIDAKSDASFDPLFDDEPNVDGDAENEDGPKSQSTTLSVPGSQTPSFVNGTGMLPTPSSTPASSQAQLGRPTNVAAPKNAPPLLDSVTYSSFSPDTFLTASIDGQVILWDRRAGGFGGVGRLEMSEKTPPWCVSACWSANGEQIYAGRRNGTVDIWDVRQIGRSGPANTPRIMKTLRNPLSSGVVSCVVAFPDSRHLACASQDNIRLWNVAEAGEPSASGRMKSGAQFKIIPGHHGGYISQMLVDPAARFLVSASSNRGWHGDSTRTVFVHETKHIR